MRRGREAPGRYPALQERFTLLDMVTSLRGAIAHPCCKAPSAPGLQTLHEARSA